MGEVVDLQEARKDGIVVQELPVWTCECDNITFNLVEGGNVLCAHCGRTQLNIRHHDPLEDDK